MPLSSQILTRAVNILIIINLVLFFIDTQSRNGLGHILSLHFPQNEKHQIWQYISHMFMHGDYIHLIFNMFALWMFGSALESVLGRLRFFIFYFAAGIGAAAIYTFINTYQFNQIYNVLADSGYLHSDIFQLIKETSYPPKILNQEQAEQLLSTFYVPMLGASGAIYGVLVAFAIFFPNYKMVLFFIPYPIAAKYFIPVLICIDLFSGITGLSLLGGGVAHFAHVGGAIIGFLLIFIWRQEFTKK